LKFENFLADMGERPAETTLDRRDNDKGYEPSNCRWATDQQQMDNTRTNSRNKLGVRGVSRNPRSRRRPWVAHIVLNGKNTYLGSFYDVASASEAYEKARATRAEQNNMESAT